MNAHALLHLSYGNEINKDSIEFINFIKFITKQYKKNKQIEEELFLNDISSLLLNKLDISKLDEICRLDDNEEEEIREGKLFAVFLKNRVIADFYCSIETNKYRMYIDEEDIDELFKYMFE